MGRAKNHWMDLQAKGITSVPDKQVCSKHFEDRFINSFIRKNYRDGFCSYCNKELKVVDLEDVVEFIMDHVSLFYEDAANFMSYDSAEGGYLGTTYSADELIQDCIDLITEPFEVTEDIVSSIEELAWAEPDAYYDTEGDELNYSWQNFQEKIKHRTRYLFSTSSTETSAIALLKQIGNLISKLGIIRTIPKGQILYRCRQHDSKTKFTSFEQLTAPENENAVYPNRFSPSGIGMFYAAFDDITAIVETVTRADKKKRYITVGKFETLQDLTIVDFSKLPALPSIFGVKNKRRYYLIMFLHSFVRDLTKPIKKDGREHTEYVPTQVVTEYLRYPFNKNRKHNISGLVYHSSQTENTNAAVFFWNKKTSSEFVELKSIKRSKVTKIFEQ